MDGAVVLDKPSGITSHSVVLAARRLLSESRIGHLGTLDPMASGGLVLLVGPANRLARKGQAVALEAVPVVIRELELLSVEGPLVRFRARVSAGTYLRSLAHDFGQRMGSGAHLAQLRRTAAGGFAEASAVGLG